MIFSKTTHKYTYNCNGHVMNIYLAYRQLDCTGRGPSYIMTMQSDTTLQNGFVVQQCVRCCQLRL